MISAYAELLARKLRFDPSLSRRVWQEVEDHLWEAVAADPDADRLEAQRRAIANFGDAQAIAAEFAVGLLAKQTKRVGTAIILVVAGVFIAMEARLAWYGVTQWVLSDDAKAVGGIVGSIDRYAFWLAVIIGAVAWAYISSRQTPASFYPSYRRQLRIFFFLCAMAAGAVIAAVISDGILTGLRLFETRLSVDFLIPIVSMAIEITGAGVLVLYLRGMTRRAAHMVALLKT